MHVCQAVRPDGLGGPWPGAWQRGLYGVGALLGRYAWARVDEAATASHWARLNQAHWVHALWRALQWAGSAWRVAVLFNFLAFLRWGSYRHASKAARLAPRTLLQPCGRAEGRAEPWQAAVCSTVPQPRLLCREAGCIA